MKTRFAAAPCVALLGFVVINRQTADTGAGALSDFHTSYAVGPLLMFFAALSALLIRDDEDAASRMNSRAGST